MPFSNVPQIIYDNVVVFKKLIKCKLKKFYIRREGDVILQSAIKPRKLTVDECLEQFLPDPILNRGMTDLLSFVRELKMNPCWYNGSSYRCNYKGKRVAYINFGKENSIRIRVCMINVMHTPYGDMDLYLKMLSDELKIEYQNYLDKLQSCKPCPANGCKDVCMRSRIYDINNPTQEQFSWIKKFVLARMEFINNAAV